MVAGGGCGEHVGRSLHESGEEPLVSCGLDRKAQQNQRKAYQPVIRARSFFDSQAQQQREIGDGALLEFLFVEMEQMRKVAGRGGVLEPKFYDRSG